MRYKTVNLHPDTYARLKLFQVRGKSLSDVVDDLMEDVDPRKFYGEDIEEALATLKEVEGGSGLTVAELEERLPWLRKRRAASIRAPDRRKRPSSAGASRTRKRKGSRKKAVGRHSKA
jgi:predicted CopG family antitoxin